MAPYAYAITYRTAFHGKQEDMDFVFHYDMSIGEPTTQGFIDVCVAIRNALMPCYRPDTAFVRGRVWGPTDAAEEDNQMRAAVDWASSNGTNTTGTSLAPELAILLRWDLGRSDAGYRQILKKFMRGAAVSSATTDQLQGRTALTDTQKNIFTTAGSTLEVIGIGGVTNTLCNPAGKVFSSLGTPTVGDYIVSRQIRRGRKRKVPAA